MIDLRDENAKNTINGGKYSNLNIPGKLKKLTIKISTQNLHKFRRQ